MKFIIIGKNIDVTPGLKDAVESKLGKLQRYFTPDTEIHVTLSVQKEQQKPGGKHCPNPAPSDFLLLDTLRAEAREREQQKGKEFRVENVMEQPGGAVEVHQHPVHDTDFDAPQPYGFVTIPIEVYDHQ